MTAGTISIRVKATSPPPPVQQLPAERRNPYKFDGRPVSEPDLGSLFAAARWVASSYDEQSWTYFAATRENPAEFRRLLSCLASANKIWAKAAPVLILGVVGSKFSETQQDKRSAIRSLGLASADLVMEATSRGLSVHQTRGILPDRAREIYGIPEHAEAWTAMAIGYTAKAKADALPEEGPREHDPAAAAAQSDQPVRFSAPRGQPSSLAPRASEPATK